jgi:hypothetical protein
MAAGPQRAPHNCGEGPLLERLSAGGRIPAAGAVPVRRGLEHRRAPTRRNRQDIRLRGALLQAIGDGLDGHVAASQPGYNGVDLVLEAEGRRAWQRIPTGSRVHDPLADAAHHIMPIVALGAGGRDFGSLAGDRGNHVIAMVVSEPNPTPFQVPAPLERGTRLRQKLDWHPTLSEVLPHLRGETPRLPPAVPQFSRVVDSTLSWCWMDSRTADAAIGPALGALIDSAARSHDSLSGHKGISRQESVAPGARRPRPH